MLKKGSVVLYKNQSALIVESGEKYGIVFSGGSQNVREKDIALLHEGPLLSLSELEKITHTADEKEALNKKFDEAWELLQEESQPDFTLSAIAELALGSFKAAQAWLVYSLLTSHPKFSLVKTQNPAQPCFTLRSSEEAELFSVKKADKTKEKEERASFIQRLKQKKLILPQDGVFMTEVEALALGKTDKSKILQEAGFSQTPEKAHKLLLDCGIWTIYRNPYPTRRGLSMQSANETLKYADSGKREKLNHTAYAIDNEWSTDPDDAIAFDGTYVWIHIADPAASVLPDSAADKDARARGATLYTPEGAARMLCEESLADYALGLNEDQASRALSFRIKLNENGGVEEADVLKTLVNVQRLTYAQADEKSGSKELAPLFEIAHKNAERRKNAGAVFIHMPEVHIALSQNQNETQKPKVAVTPFVRYKSAEVVREFMLLAGEAAARFAFKNAIPFPYIRQEKPDIPQDLPDALAGQYKLRRCMKSRSVGISPAAHAGLGLGMYSQVTSPLRRYGDLVAHQQLHAFLNGLPLLSKDTVLERIAAGDASSSAAVQAERKSNLHWTLVYLLQNENWQGEAVAVDTKGKQTVVYIPSLAQETLLNDVQNLRLNDKVTVRASSINLPELAVTFMCV